MNTTPLGSNQMDAPYQNQVEAFVADGLGRTPETAPIHPMSLQEYRNICKAYFGEKEMLSDNLLAQRLDYLRQDSKLKEHFGPENKYCPAIIPFSNFGHPLSEQEMAKGHALCTLVIDARGLTVNGFSQNPSHVFNRLPLEVQQLAFGVNAYAHNDLYTVSHEEREKIVIKYEMAYLQLRKLLVG